MTQPGGMSEVSSIRLQATLKSLKAEILSSLRSELAEIFRTELRSMLGDDLSTIKSELQVVKVEFSNTMVSMQSGMSTLKSTVKDMEQYFYLFG